MPPLIPNNAADGPSLVRDVARSELVPGRGGTGTRTPLPPRERDLQLCFRFYYRIMAFKRGGGDGKAQGLEHPPLPTYLSPVVVGTAGAFPGGDSATTTTWDVSVPAPGCLGPVAVQLAQPSKGHRWGTRERRDVALPHAWMPLGAGSHPSATGLVTTSRN